jgi:hypothetical protein
MSLDTHELAAAKRRLTRSRRNGPATVEQVSPEAMALAIELADGDVRRVQVIDARTVLIRNKP